MNSWIEATRGLFVFRRGPADLPYAPLLRADLRHAGGYAVRLRGVTVAEGPAGAKGGTP